VPDLTGWTVYARDASLTRQAQLDDYQFLDMVVRFNDVGTWTLDMDANARGASILEQDGSGIVVTRTDPNTGAAAVVMSGPVTFRERDVGGDPDRNRLKLKGEDDNTYLNRFLAHPQPSTAAPPYNSQGWDVRTGVCSTILRQYVDVNIGGSALAVRQVPGLSLAADPGIGISITGRARWQSLLTFLQDLALAGGDIGFQIQEAGSGIQFSIYQPMDHSTSVVFAPALANLAAYDWSEAAPKQNYVFVGGGGEDVSRVIVESQDAAAIARWGRIESFRDRRDTSVTAELLQQGSTELMQGQAALGFNITPVDLPQMTYLTHYNLGDKVSVLNDGVLVSNIVREVHITLGDAGGTGNSARIVPLIATPQRQDLLAIFDELRKLRRRVANLERI
jgi:hypothetical protein